MKLLFLVRRLPVTPLDGFSLYLANIIPDLLKNYHVSIACYAATDHEVKRLSNELGSQIKVHRYSKKKSFHFSMGDHLSTRPATLTNDKGFVSWVKKKALTKRYHLAIIGGNLLAPFIFPIRKKMPVMYIALDSSARNKYMLGCTQPVHLKLWSWAQAAKWYGYEKRVVRRASASVFVSPVDREYVTGKEISKTCYCVPNGVDFDTFNLQKKVKKKYDIAISGNFAYSPNSDGLNHFLNSIDKYPRLMNRKILVCGRPASSYLNEKLKAKSNITVSWNVPDMAKAIGQAKVYLCPVRFGSGIRNNVLQAMACGIPVVTYPINLEALVAIDGVHCLSSGSIDRLFENVVELLEDAKKRNSIASNGYEYVIKHHNWKLVSMKIEELVNKCFQT